MPLDIFTIISLILANLVLFIAVFFILALVLGALFLMLGLRVVNGQNRGFGTVFVTVLIGVILSLIPCLGCILYWYIIKTRHQTGWGGAIGAWLIAGLIPILIVVAVLFVFFFATGAIWLLLGP
jgi:hypothetical protein